MERTFAQTMTRTLVQAEAEGRWKPCDEAREALYGVERALAVSIQTGQPALEAMNDGIMSRYGERLMEIARADYAGCRIACPNLAEIRLLGAPSTVVAHAFVPVRPAIAKAA